MSSVYVKNGRIFIFWNEIRESDFYFKKVTFERFVQFVCSVDFLSYLVWPLLVEADSGCEL